MREVSHFPYDVKVLEHIWIPMRDGCRLAARVWLPTAASETPAPALLEYIPYRKDDGARARDALNHPYFAGHGYASLRVDMRGSGNSEGVLTDEYLELEQQDALDILQWLAAQPWCNGRVGMFGISWGGFNALQVAALQPPELAAVIAVCATDDRYADDVHYMGGCLLGDNLSWASTMFSFNSCPPDPRVVGEDWRDRWRERLERSGLWVEKWLRHQRRDAYWRHGSICENYADVRCPVLVASGWADGYSHATLRMLRHLEVPRRGFLGPWSHLYPHGGMPGPAVGFLQECLRWWERWLRDEPNGVEDDPMLVAFMSDSVPPSKPVTEQRPGRWVTEAEWPAPGIVDRRYSLRDGRLDEAGHSDKVELTAFQSPLRLGLFAGKWCSYAAPADLPSDQREEDGGAAVFETEPLDETLEMLGGAELQLEVASDRPQGMVCARLSDVRPDGSTTRVTYGLLNLTHRDGHADPTPLEADRFYTVRLQLNEVAQRFPAGHRIRLALSTSYWPLAWTPPERTRLTLRTAGCHLTLPVRTPREENGREPFGAPEAAPALPRTMRAPTEQEWRVVRDLVRDVSMLEVINDRGIRYFEQTGMEMGVRAEERYYARDDDFTSPEGVTEWRRLFRRGEWETRARTKTRMTCDEDNFYLEAELSAEENGQVFFERSWNVRVPRDQV